jgi:hypothetical protein
MSLIRTKETLKRLLDRYGNELKRAQPNIKPDYTETYAVGMGVGYVYKGIEHQDIGVIYEAISSLNGSINDPCGAIYFDLTYFVTEENAMKELDRLGEYILKDLTKLLRLREKYKDKECARYPIEMCTNYHQEIYDILDSIFKSEEYKEFKKPGQLDKLTEENNNLRFNAYWTKRKWKYIIHLLAFFPFLYFAGWTFFHKDKHDLAGLRGSTVLVISGLLTIAFNLFFNNHNSFKDSWKLILQSSRQQLKDKERQVFLKLK